MRDGWSETDNYLLIDCGEFGFQKGGHGHADALAIDLAVGGESILVDAGTYTYHESETLRNNFRTTAAHNTLIIDGKSQSEPEQKIQLDDESRSKIEKMDFRTALRFF